MVNGERAAMKIIHGDCLGVLPTLGLDVRRTAVLSDPPYGMGNDTDSTRFSGGHSRQWRGGLPSSGRDWPEVIGDDRPFDPTPWLAFPKVCLWGANHFGRRLPVGTTLVWVKRYAHAYGTFLSDAEIGWMKGGCGVYLHQDLSMIADASGRLHPNQKPVGLMDWCIKRMKIPEGWTILDPYCGSGTTGLVATALGYDFVGIELNPAYVETARRRLADAVGPLFAGLK